MVGGHPAAAGSLGDAEEGGDIFLQPAVIALRPKHSWLAHLGAFFYARVITVNDLRFQEVNSDLTNQASH